MKKVVLIIFFIVLGIGIYNGRSLYEHLMIKVQLHMMIPDTSFVCQQQPQKSIEYEQLREQICSLVQKENEQLKQLARSSKTYEEFVRESEQLLTENDEKFMKILKSYKEISSKQEDVAQ